MIRSLLVALIVAVLLAGWLSRPAGITANPVPGYQPDPDNGRLLASAGGCASCHGSLVEGKPDKVQLGGGLELPSPVGVFRVPNISSHPGDGIGDWTEVDFINAMRHGVSPAGQHYFPAFPYASYTRMTTEDLLDLQAWLRTLPAVAGRAGAHELTFPFGFRPAIGWWKRLFLSAEPVVDLSDQSDLIQRGRYLVEGPGHCGECHTPRNWGQAMDTTRWLHGAPDPGGEGRVPNLIEGLADWSADDIAYYLASGMDPEFDFVGGDMVAVQENMSVLPDGDRQAIAAYLKHLESDSGL